MRPLTIPTDIKKYLTPDIDLEKFINETKEGYSRLLKDDHPLVTVSIPAYNEEKTIVQTLHSICQNITSYSVEVIVTNNNSKDGTARLVKACGISCFFESKQGISFARDCGLAHARGKYLINADADTIYPKKWIEKLIKPLEENKEVVLTYGRFSLLPIKKTPRLTYFIYEYFADASRKWNKHFKDEAVNVYGFNSAFRKEYAFNVNGFEHPPGTIEDGYLALKLRDKGFGKLHYVKKALVWTTDRRLHIDGGLWIGTIKRIRRVLHV